MKVDRRSFLEATASAVLGAFPAALDAKQEPGKTQRIGLSVLAEATEPQLRLIDNSDLIRVSIAPKEPIVDDVPLVDVDAAFRVESGPASMEFRGHCMVVAFKSRASSLVFDRVEVELRPEDAWLCRAELGGHYGFEDFIEMNLVLDLGPGGRTSRGRVWLVELAYPWGHTLVPIAKSPKNGRLGPQRLEVKNIARCVYLLTDAHEDDTLAGGHEPR